MNIWSINRYLRLILLSIKSRLFHLFMDDKEIITTTLLIFIRVNQMKLKIIKELFHNIDKLEQCSDPVFVVSDNHQVIFYT